MSPWLKTELPPVQINVAPGDAGQARRCDCVAGDAREVITVGKSPGKSPDRVAALTETRQQKSMQ